MTAIAKTVSSGLEPDKSFITNLEISPKIKDEKANNKNANKYRQSTLEGFVKSVVSDKQKKEEGKENTSTKKIKIPKIKVEGKQEMFLDLVKPTKFDIPEGIPGDLFIESLEILEFAHKLAFIFCPNAFEQINRREIYIDFIKSLKKQNSFNFHTLYQVMKIFIIAIIELENYNNSDSKTKALLKYTHAWNKNKQYLTYETLPEFIRFFINIAAFSTGQNDKSIYRYKYLGDFYTFPFHDKLKIFELLYEDIITHVSFSRILDEIVQAKKKYRLKISSSTVDTKEACNESSITKSLRNFKITNKKPFQYLDCDSIDDIQELIRCLTILEECYRNLPISINNKIFIWNFEILSFVLIENTITATFEYYDYSHLPLLKSLTNDHNESSDIIQNIINILDNRPEYLSQKIEHIDIVSIVEEAKKIICEIIQHSIINHASFQYLKQKLINLNKTSPFDIKPWAILFSDFIYKTWQHLKYYYDADLPSSPMRASESLSTYTNKLISWSGLYLSATIVQNTFDSIPNIKNRLSKLLFQDTDDDDDNNDESSSTKRNINYLKGKVECSQCKKLFENSEKNQHKLLIVEWYCRSCRYERRRGDSAKKVSKPLTTELINKKRSSLRHSTILHKSRTSRPILSSTSSSSSESSN